jgi:hypothetical protein
MTAVAYAGKTTLKRPESDPISCDSARHRHGAVTPLHETPEYTKGSPMGLRCYQGRDLVGFQVGGRSHRIVSPDRPG